MILTGKWQLMNKKQQKQLEESLQFDKESKEALHKDCHSEIICGDCGNIIGFSDRDLGLSIPIICKGCQD